MDKTYDLTKGARRLEKVSASPIRAMLDRAAALRAQGIDVIPFSAGEPDFNTPSDIKEAAIRAITNNYSHYTSNRGYPPLRLALREHIRRETGVEYDPEGEILITTGGAEALNNVITAFVDPEDEVIVLTPSFITYRCLVNFCQATVVDVPLRPEDGFQIDLEAVRAAVTDRTKMLILNNPCNPTGAVFSREALEGLSRLAVERNFLVLSDEMYSRLVYDGAEFCSMASFPGMKELTILVSGFSKTFAMTGWRLGYVAAAEKLADRVLRVHQYCSTCSPTFIQAALAEAMDTPLTRRQVQDMVEGFDRRRRVMTAGLDQIGGLSYVPPQGAFYVMVNVSGLGLSGEAFAQRLLEEKHVATVPAVGLGAACGDFVRLSYATSEENIAEGLRRIAQFAAEQRRG